MTQKKVDWELVVLALFVLALGAASLWQALLPQLSQLTRNLLQALGLVLALTGSCVLYLDPRLESRWALGIVLAKDVTIAIAFLILGLALGGSGC